MHTSRTLQKGLSELVSYISIAKNSDEAIVDESIKTQIEVLDFDGNKKIVRLAKIIFTKGIKK